MKSLYKIPTMTEINAIQHNGYNVVSTFSGGGGSCTGYRMSGCKVLWANEFIDEAVNTYKSNHSTTIVDKSDIRTITASKIKESIGDIDVDIFDGSPPCSAFSTSGKRDKKWGKTSSYSDDKSQIVDDLFFEYSRILKDLKPKVFIAENVSGLVKGTAIGYFKIILDELKKCGYNVKASLLNAAFMGVPQARQRLIFIGVRTDLNLQPVFPKPFTYRYNVNEILPHIRQIRMGGRPNNWSLSDRPSPTITASDGGVSRTGYLSCGGFVRTDKGETRKYTINELKMISSFPSDYVLTGNFVQQWERIGRSVPPLMMKLICDTVIEEILCKIK